MNKSCREAYDIYCQYNNVSQPSIREEVKCINNVIQSYLSKDASMFTYSDFTALSRFIIETLSGEKLSLYEQQLIMKKFSSLNITTWGGAPRLVNETIKAITKK